jgi:hypothetical protein
MDKDDTTVLKRQGDKFVTRIITSAKSAPLERARGSNKPHSRRSLPALKPKSAPSLISNMQIKDMDTYDKILLILEDYESEFRLFKRLITKLIKKKFLSNIGNNYSYLNDYQFLRKFLGYFRRIFIVTTPEHRVSRISKKGKSITYIDKRIDEKIGTKLDDSEYAASVRKMNTYARRLAGIIHAALARKAAIAQTATFARKVAISARRAASTRGTSRRAASARGTLTRNTVA